MKELPLYHPSVYLKLVDWINEGLLQGEARPDELTKNCLVVDYDNGMHVIMRREQQDIMLFNGEGEQVAFFKADL